MHKIIKFVPALLIWLSVSVAVTHAAPLVESVQKIRVINKYGTSDEHTFNHPARIIYNPPSGHIFVLDAGIPKVVVFDTLGNLVRNFPESNQPPDSLEEPGDIILHKGFVWLLDRTGSKIHQFTTEGQHLGSVESGYMPFYFTGIGSQLVASHLIGDEMIPYDMYTGDIPRGYSKDPSKFSVVLGMLKIFSKMVVLTSNPYKEIYGAYLYKNRVEKYNNDLKRIERIDLTENVDNIVPTKKEKTDDGKIVFDGGTMFARDICYHAGRVFVLWRVEEPSQPCEGDTHISVFDRSLRKQTVLPVEECLESFYIGDRFMFATSVQPQPSVIIYRLEYSR